MNKGITQLSKRYLIHEITQVYIEILISNYQNSIDIYLSNLVFFMIKQVILVQHLLLTFEIMHWLLKLYPICDKRK